MTKEKLKDDLEDLSEEDLQKDDLDELNDEEPTEEEKETLEKIAIKRDLTPTNFKIHSQPSTHSPVLEQIAGGEQVDELDLPVSKEDFEDKTEGIEYLEDSENDEKYGGAINPTQEGRISRNVHSITENKNVFDKGFREVYETAEVSEVRQFKSDSPQEVYKTSTPKKMNENRSVLEDDKPREYNPK